MGSHFSEMERRGILHLHCCSSVLSRFVLRLPLGVIVGVGFCFYGQNGLSLHMVPQFEEPPSAGFFFVMPDGFVLWAAFVPSLVGLSFLISAFFFSFLRLSFSIWSF